MPTVVSVLAVVPVLFVLNFLFVSPVSDLFLSKEAEGAAASEVESSTPVVVVLFDEFSGASLTGRDGRIDASRYPNFARLARVLDLVPQRDHRGRRDHLGRTRACSLAAARSRAASDRGRSSGPTSSRCWATSYRLNVSEPATDLCPERLCGGERRPSTGSRLRGLFDDLSVVSGYLVLPERLEDDLPAVDQNFAGFREGGEDTTAASAADLPAGGLENRARQFDRFLSGLGRPSRRPTLDFIHVALPHSPWEYLPSGQSYPVSGPDIPGVGGDTWSDDPELSTQAYQRYLLQMGFADRQIGRLLQRLEETGSLDRSLLVVTADHGVGFRAGKGRRAVDGGSLAEIANVPLFVKEPGQRAGRVDDGPALTIDVLPTIAQSLGIDRSDRFDGRPLPRAGSQNERIEDTHLRRRGRDDSLRRARSPTRSGDPAPDPALRRGQRLRRRVRARRVAGVAGPAGGRARHVHSLALRGRLRLPRGLRRLQR